MSRLDLSTLDNLPAAVATPRYDPRLVGIGIVHLGIGAFHRAQTAMFSDDALAIERADWGICGVSLRSADVRDRLVPQDGLYTAVEKSPDGTRRRIIGSVREVLFLGDQRDAVRTRLIEPETRIVSLTITEKGYCHDPATGELNRAHPDIAHDLAHPEQPRERDRADRRRAGRAQAVARPGLHRPVLRQPAAQRRAGARAGRSRSPKRAMRRSPRWIADHASFPSTMVDRIVPATTDADIADNDAALGLHDAAPVIHEPFRQWAIEDNFVDGRPAWDRVGAELVADVAPFEAMKLRLLNGSHSALAYLGFLAGCEFIYQVAAEPDFVAYMRRMMAARSRADAQGAARRRPRGRTRTRWSSASAILRCRIARSRSRWTARRSCRSAFLGTVRDNLAAGRSVRPARAGDRRLDALCRRRRRARSRDRRRRSAGSRIQPHRGAHRGDPAALARALLGIRAVFGDDLPAERALCREAHRARSHALVADGAQRTVARPTGGG